MIIGTAGHIDHGKSTLVTALTGRPMDRLAEERRREITIELNFAPLELSNGKVAGMIDVPGHEDFVRTMVAGASGIDLALLVIAADEGLMPQTEEHLLILEQLGIERGIAVITKADLVEADWLQLVMLETAERLAGSSIAFDEPLVVSARSGQGLEELRRAIEEHAQRADHRPARDAFRMPVDRVFSLPGVGTVVTGTAWSGRVTIGDSVIALPSGAGGRVRSLESYGRAVERTQPGARIAVGIAGLDRDEVARGAVLVTHQLPWAPTSALDVDLTLDHRAPRSLTPRTRVRVLMGTAEVMARVIPRTEVEPGGSGLARLRLETPLVARAGDRLVLRSFSPVATIGGGRVLDPLPPRGGLWPPELAADSPAERLRAILQRRPRGVERFLLPILLGIPEQEANEVAGKEPEAHRLVGSLWIRRSAIEELTRRGLAVLRDYHREHPSQPGMPLQTLRHSLRAADAVVDAALDDAVHAGRIRRTEGLAALAGFGPRVAGGDQEVARIVRILEQANLAPPSVAELERSTGWRDLYPLLRLAASRGQIEAVERDRYYSRQALDRFTEALQEMGQAGPIVPAKVRDRLGVTRKYLIPLLEWADGRGITVREGEGRRLRP
ncbi:MAG: selenocysteine-specific translation elongation factor [Gemmatimonadales bacterium]